MAFEGLTWINFWGTHCNALKVWHHQYACFKKIGSSNFEKLALMLSRNADHHFSFHNANVLKIYIIIYSMWRQVLPFYHYCCIFCPQGSRTANPLRWLRTPLARPEQLTDNGHTTLWPENVWWHTSGRPGGYYLPHRSNSMDHRGWDGKFLKKYLAAMQLEVKALCRSVNHFNDCTAV